MREVATEPKRRGRHLEIRLCLLGAWHDRWIRLTYTGVTQYSLRKHAATTDDVEHGDLTTHEIRLSSAGLLVHEILFDGDATLLIECADIRHEESRIPESWQDGQPEPPGVYPLVIHCTYTPC